MKTTVTQPQESIHVNEDFVNIDTRILDSKHRITLSDKVMKAITLKTRKVDSYQILASKDGDILLRPAVSIPAREAWIYENPGVLKSIRKGLQEAKQGKGEIVHNLDKFLDDL